MAPSHASTVAADNDIEAGKTEWQLAPPKKKSLFAYMQEVIDSKKCNLISIYACFLTGYTSSVSFSACFIWCVMFVSHNSSVSRRHEVYRTALRPSEIYRYRRSPVTQLLARLHALHLAEWLATSPCCRSEQKQYHIA